MASNGSGSNGSFPPKLAVTAFDPLRTLSQRRIVRTMRTIERRSTDDSIPYLHLIPLIEMLIEHGNKPVPSPKSNRWGLYVTRGGWLCDLQKPIDFELVQRTFELPGSLKLSPEAGTIFCENSWIEIRGPKGHL